LRLREAGNDDEPMSIEQAFEYETEAAKRASVDKIEGAVAYALLAISASLRTLAASVSNLEQTVRHRNNN
jgi:hypothetical protein